MWFWLLQVVPPPTPAPLLERLQLLLTRVTGLGVLTVLLLSDWLLLLLLLLMVLGDEGEDDARLSDRPCRLDGQCSLSILSSSWIRTGPLITCRARLPPLLCPGGRSPVVPLSLSFSIFLSRLVHFFLGGLSGKQASASRLMVDDPPPLSPGEGGPLKEVSREWVLLVEEQREELLLVSRSSGVLAVAFAEATGRL